MAPPSGSHSVPPLRKQKAMRVPLRLPPAQPPSDRLLKKVSIYCSTPLRVSLFTSLLKEMGWRFGAQQTARKQTHTRNSNRGMPHTFSPRSHGQPTSESAHFPWFAGEEPKTTWRTQESPDMAGGCSHTPHRGPRRKEGRGRCREHGEQTKSC